MNTSRNAIIAGNWKMNYGPTRAMSFAAEIVPEIGHILHTAPHMLSVLCPPTISLSAVRGVLASTPEPRIALGAQNMYFEEQGAFTGEASPIMVRDLCSMVILGHSERRMYFCETDELVNKKVQAALQHHLRPIVCIGENNDQHGAHQTHDVIQNQIRSSLASLPAEQVHEVIIAYEPIWAIGTGKAATPEGAEQVIGLIRQLYSEMYGTEAGNAVHILYGGSVTSNNITEFMSQPDIDGALVGGASIKPDFIEIVRKTAAMK
jgi:triosephosphate isomerase